MGALAKCRHFNRAPLGSSHIYLALLACLSCKDRLSEVPDKLLRQVERIVMPNSLVDMENLAVEIDGEQVAPLFHYVVQCRFIQLES